MVEKLKKFSLFLLMIKSNMNFLKKFKGPSPQNNSPFTLLDLHQKYSTGIKYREHCKGKLLAEFNTAARLFFHKSIEKSEQFFIFI